MTARSRSSSVFSSATAATGSAHKRQATCSRSRLAPGETFPHYPADVRLTGIDLSPQMLDLARRAAATQGREVDLREGDAQALELPDNSFDTVTCTLSLCTIADDQMAIREIYRVLRTGGRFVLMEHVRSPALRTPQG